MLKKSQTNGGQVGKCSLIFMILIAMAFALPQANADIFYDNFEDGNSDGWVQSNTGGTATFNVVYKNESNRAHVRHVSNTSSGDQSSLSITVDYIATECVSFDMEALAFLNSHPHGTCHGLAGVKISFLNTFNIPLGSAGLYNVTSNSLLGTNDSAIGCTQQHFSAMMEEYASLANLGNSDSIAKMSFSFLTYGKFIEGLYIGGHYFPDARSGGDVWFDNFSVGQIPEPATLSLFAFGGLTLLRKHK